jgi:hypothetical protein
MHMSDQTAVPYLAVTLSDGILRATVEDVERSPQQGVRVLLDRAGHPADPAQAEALLDSVHVLLGELQNAQLAVA